MASFEEQLRIVSLRSKVHEFIDEIPEDDTVVVLHLTTREMSGEFQVKSACQVRYANAFTFLGVYMFLSRYFDELANKLGVDEGEEKTDA